MDEFDVFEGGSGNDFFDCNEGAATVSDFDESEGDCQRKLWSPTVSRY